MKQDEGITLLAEESHGIPHHAADQERASDDHKGRDPRRNKWRAPFPQGEQCRCVECDSERDTCHEGHEQPSPQTQLYQPQQEPAHRVFLSLC